MKENKWRAYGIFVVLTEAVGALAGVLTREGVTEYGMAAKPALTPPAAVFPVVWTLLFALMGIGAARIWLSPPSGVRTRGLALFFLQLAVNFFWSILFFNRQAYGAAFLWLVLLWVLIAAMTATFAKVDRTAAYLQIPYLLWVTFAGYLSFMVWRMN